ncbi:MAG: Xaa-Pro peptidase family protein [Lachnospiraceae bacterium]|nr:Xaa-Pro peptidase family protein [Lachnospiraceae bacterium]
MNEFYMKRLTEELQNSPYDAMMLSPGEELRFLLGDFDPMLCERFQGLFVKQDGEMFYICNLLYQEEFRAALPASVRLYAWFDGEVMTEVVEKALAQEGLLGGTIAVNSTAQAFNVLEIMDKVDVTFKNGKPLLERMRIHKTHEELEALRDSAAIVDQVFGEVISFIHPGQSEKEIQDFLLRRMTELGGGSAECIVGCGANSSYPHYSDCQGIVAENDMVLLDYGCTMRGMYSDMTRMVFVGEPDAKRRAIYDLVVRSNVEAEKLVCEGAFVPDIDRRAREVLDEKGLAYTLINRLGHGIGYTIHEAPDIKQSNPICLERGMAFSIEPGVYLAGDFGVRIEDVVVVNEKGECEVLNHATKEMVFAKFL